MRLFIAIDVPEDVSEHLKVLQKRIKNGKFTFPSQFHLTLKFLGDVHPNKLSEVKNLLSKIEVSQFKANLSSLGIFPEHGPVRVVWAGLEPKDLLFKLHEQIDSVLKPFFEPEKRFEPHVTLARVKFLNSPSEFCKNLTKIQVHPLSFEVNSFKLYESKLTPQGPEYSVKEILNFQPKSL